MRESNGEITEKNGFSVVAAISVTSGFPTGGQQGVLLAQAVDASFRGGFGGVALRGHKA